MTPPEAVSTLVHILATTTPPFSEDDIYEALDRSGMAFDIADRTYKFAQIACGRLFLDGLGVRFSNDYVCFDANGEVLESGPIDEEPYYVAATRLAIPEAVGGASFSYFAVMSADVRSVNALLNNGSSPEDLTTGPAGLFLEVPTELGLGNAERVLSHNVQPQPLPRKPWWRIW